MSAGFAFCATEVNETALSKSADGKRAAKNRIELASLKVQLVKTSTPGLDNGLAIEFCSKHFVDLFWVGFALRALHDLSH